MQASLVMFKADGERKEFPLNQSETVVGRKNTCDLRIPLSSVSRQHFKIEREGDALTLRDLGSSNGTFYNDDRVLEAELQAGDRIRVGPVTFTVVIDGEPSDIDPVTTVLTDDAGGAEPEPEPAVASGAEPQMPKAIDTGQEMPAQVEDEPHSPTVEIEDQDDEEIDPIAALEAMTHGDGDDDDSGDAPIPLLDDEDEDDK